MFHLPVDHIVVECAPVEKAGRCRVSHHAEISEAGEGPGNVFRKRVDRVDLVKVKPERSKSWCKGEVGEAVY